MARDIGLNFLTKTFFRRILLVLLPFTALVVYAYSEIIVSSMKAAENRTVQEYLRSEYSLFERRYADTGSLQLPSTNNLSAWWGDDAHLPDSLANLEPGIHALKGSRHLLVADPEGAGRRVYFVLSEPELGSTQMIRSEMESTIYLAGALVFVSGAFLAVFVARLVSQPVRALAKSVQSGPTHGKPLTGHRRNDEVGVLSRALGDLIDRMESALSREKAVTRYASHDMRTPVSVIRIALSVLQMPDCDDDKRERNLMRIDEACADIEDRIEVHLSLARESARLPEEDCDVREIIESELAKHGHTISAKQLSVTIDQTIAENDTRICTTRSMLRIVLGNLIQNAVSYSGQSTHIAIDSTAVVIRNSSELTVAEDGEPGLGLEIVQRVCDRMRWSFSSQHQDGEFVAQVLFNRSDARGETDASTAGRPRLSPAKTIGDSRFVDTSQPDIPSRHSINSR